MKSSSARRLRQPAGWALDFYRLVARLFPWGLFVAVPWIKLSRRYRIEDLKAVREAYRKLALEKPGPVLLCSTHPTLSDAAVLVWALASPFDYIKRPWRYPWVVTDPSLFRVFRLRPWLGLFTKSVYLRQGAGFSTNARALSMLEGLFARNETVLVFPEGTRVDRAPSYLVGRMLQKFPELSVICVRLHCDAAVGSSKRAAQGSRFTIALERITPATTARGAHGVRDLAVQVQAKLSAGIQA